MRKKGLGKKHDTDPANYRPRRVNEKVAYTWPVASPGTVVPATVNPGSLAPDPTDQDYSNHTTDHEAKRNHSGYVFDGVTNICANF